MTPEETVAEFVRRVTTKDLDGACELVSADLEYDNVPMGKNFGREGLKSFLEPMVGGVEEVEFVTHRQTVTGNVVMNERTDRFKFGEHWLDLPVAGVFVIDDDGLISLWRDYFDAATFTDRLNEILSGGS